MSRKSRCEFKTPLSAGKFQITNSISIRTYLTLLLDFISELENGKPTMHFDKALKVLKRFGFEFGIRER